MMSTMAVLPGVRPAAEACRPLELAVVDGLLFSQLITLYLTRVYYTHLGAAVAAVGRAPGPSAGESRRAAAPRDRDRGSRQRLRAQDGPPVHPGRDCPHDRG